jgi:hypothetical protein
MAWQRLKVIIKGEAEPFDVITSARDWASLTFDEMQTTGAVFKVAHNALVRTGAPVPLNYDAFLEVLDGIPETAEEDTAALDPTQTDR